MLKLILTASILIISLASCFDMFVEPHTTLIKASPNSDSTKKAVLLQNDGNATVDLSLQVSILDYSYKLSGKETGNAFTVDRNHGTRGLDSASINFTWISKDTLQIDYDQKLRIFIQENHVDDVTVV